MAEASNLTNFLKRVAANNMLLFQQLYRISAQFLSKASERKLATLNPVRVNHGPLSARKTNSIISALLSRPAGIKLEGSEIRQGSRLQTHYSSLKALRRGKDYTRTACLHCYQTHKSITHPCVCVCRFKSCRTVNQLILSLMKTQKAGFFIKLIKD